MAGDFEGKVVLVTGSARGLGASAARMFAERGAKLFLVDLLAEPLKAVQAELRAGGAACEIAAVDISKRQACVDAVAAAVKAFGQLDVLVNAAAIVRFNHITDIPEQEWEQLLAVNLSAPFYLSQAAIPHLLKTGGNIVNVGSQAANMGCAYIAAYAATKGAMVQLTKSMAMEYIKQPLRVNMVAPGTMNTEISANIPKPADMDMELIGRYSGIRTKSEPEDVAAVIVFVASPAAKGVHGAIYCADNGTTSG